MLERTKIPSSALLAFAFLTLASCAGAGAELAALWRSAEPEAPLAGAEDVRHTHWTAGRGDGSLIHLHRYRGRGEARAALLYLPGTFMNGRVAVAEEDHNLWLYLARRGVEVFAMDYRTASLPGLVPPPPEMLEHWTLARFLEDVRHAAWQVRRTSERPKIFVAGFSRGVTFAYGLALTEPESVAGVIALDGYLKHHAPKDADDFDARRAALEKSGDWIYDVGGSRGWEARQALMRAAAEDPEGPALGGAEGTVGRQLGEILYFAFGPGALANTRAGVSSIEVLARLMGAYDRYYPKVQTPEAEALAAWVDYPRSSLDDPLGELRLPVVFFGTTGMGSEFLLHGIHSAALLSGGTPELHLLEGWGHLDLLVAEEAKERVFTPLLAWIDRHLPAGSPSAEEREGARGGQ